MGFSDLKRGLCILACLCFVFVAKANVIVEGTVFIDGEIPIAKTDENFICATLDWWPPEKCDYGTCSWGLASLLNLDLKNTVFLNSIKAFSPLKIRLGGTLQDRVIYQTENSNEPCISFARNSSELFGFSNACLPLARWDELNTLFNQSGALIIFGLNALHGKTIQPDGTATGPWDSTNAASLIRYTVKKGYNIYGWELGNELCGSGIGARIPADSYAADSIVLHDLIQDIYKGAKIKPRTISPGGFFEPNWFKQFLAKTNGEVNYITHHIYNLGPGSDAHVIDRIRDPSVLDNVIGTFQNLKSIIKSSGTSASAWVGEAGGAYNSGRNGVTNAFVFSFWYLDQLGLAAKYDTKTYCRQSLIGGNYGLLNTTTFIPNPDYYSALLWHRLMGKNVLSTSFNGTRMIRAYAHCAKHSMGVMVLLINLDGNTTVEAKININSTLTHLHKHRHHRHRSKPIHARHAAMDVELENLRSALSSWGCFQLINHGMASSFLDEVHEVSRQFFHLPMKEKQRCARAVDWIEGYGQDVVTFENQPLDWVDRLYLLVTPQDQEKLQYWPENPQSFRNVLREYTAHTVRIQNQLLKSIAKSISLPENHFLDAFGDRPIVFARFNYYPRCSRPDLVNGLRPHADGSGVTFLLQDREVKGLQLKRDNQWFQVPIIPQALLVNLGDQMEIMSNGIFKSPVHRAVTNSERERMSLAMFCAPDIGKEIGPAEELVDDERPRLYKQITNYPQTYSIYFNQGKRAIDAVRA